MNWTRIKNSNLIRASFVILAIIASLLILKLPTAPYVYIGLIWFVITLAQEREASGSLIQRAITPGIKVP